MANGKYVTYYRTSTKEQNLGIDAQKAAVINFLNGGSWTVVGEFEEKESGKSHEKRPQLAAAMALCKKTKATLLIAKLDRLARNVHFISGLDQAGIEYKACDNPYASKTMSHMLAVFAEHERDQIAQRTKDALAVLKANGAKLGNRTNLREAQSLGSASNAAKADAFAANVLPIIERIKMAGATSLRAIAAELTERGVKTARGGSWSAEQVNQILKRAV
jgi:DNA invertase Pin-like site-specific DNA recombinase